MITYLKDDDNDDDDYYDDDDKAVWDQCLFVRLLVRMRIRMGHL